LVPLLTAFFRFVYRRSNLFCAVAPAEALKNAAKENKELKLWTSYRDAT